MRILTLAQKEEKILQHLKMYGPLERNKLSKAVDIPRTTTYEVLLRLEMRKEVTTIKAPNDAGVGRSKVMWLLIA